MGLYAVFRLSAKARIQVFGMGEVWGWILRFPRMDSMDHSMVPKEEANLDREGEGEVDDLSSRVPGLK